MKNSRLTVKLIIPRYQKMFSTFYTLEIIKEVSKAAIDFGVDLLIETGWKTSSCSGVLFADVMNNEQWIKKAKKGKIPFLLLNYYEKKSKDNCIGIDNENAGFEAADYLIKVGHKDIAIITGKLNAQAGLQRLEGFKRALKEARIKLNKEYIVKGDWTKESGKTAMSKLISLKARPTAVFAVGDEMAIGAIEAVKYAGLKVPDDISVVGFDNIPQAMLSAVPLTSIEQPFSDLAKLGMKELIQIIKKKPRQPVKILLNNTKLIKRASVKELRK